MSERGGMRARRDGESGGFGHSPSAVEGWRRRVREVLSSGGRTPLHVIHPEPILERVRTLEACDFGLPARQWLSLKTQPLRDLARWWSRGGRPVEVVSAAEFELACGAGVGIEDLLINGPAKHRWLPAVSRSGLRVILDSPREAAALLPFAVRDRWEVGVRLQTVLRDREGGADPFGMGPEEAAAAVRALAAAGLEVATVHSHPGSNVRDPADYLRMLRSMAEVCRDLSLAPRHVDVGGGLPARHILGRTGRRLDAGISAASYARAVQEGIRGFPSAREVWLENGRHLLAGSGVLAVRVLDVKRRPDGRQFVCDGGRVLNAWMSQWECHALIPLEPRGGIAEETAVHGPTCMAFDRLARLPLSQEVGPGDVLLWLDAGAYHVPLETRFSHGAAEVWWSGDGVEAARRIR